MGWAVAPTDIFDSACFAAAQFTSAALLYGLQCPGAPRTPSPEIAQLVERMTVVGYHQVHGSNPCLGIFFSSFFSFHTNHHKHIYADASSQASRNTTLQAAAELAKADTPMDVGSVG